MADHSNQINRARRNVNEAAERVSDTSQDLLNATLDYVNANPVQAALIALGVGYILGRLRIPRLI